MPGRDPTVPFFSRATPYLHLRRRRSRRALFCNAATRSLSTKETLAVREVTVFAGFKYVLGSFAVAAARSAIVSTVFSVFQSKAFAKG